MTNDESPGRVSGYRTTRTEAFSDGVFAIAITLLVLEIAVPADAGEDLLGSLADQWPSYLAYIVSFASIGAVWFAHTVITEHLHHTTSVFARLNLLLLLVVSFLPFPTRLLAEYIGDSEPARVAATVYGVNLLLTSLLVSALWRYAVHSGLLHHDVDIEEVATLTRRLTPGLAGYVVMIILGLFLPVIAVVGYFALAVFILVPFRALRRGRARDGG